MIRIFDSGDQWIDQYFIVIDDEAYSMSSNPLDKTGINMHCCSDGNPRYRNKGKLVQIKDVPEDVRYAIANRIKEMINKKCGEAALYILETYGENK